MTPEQQIKSMMEAMKAIKPQNEDMRALVSLLETLFARIEPQTEQLAKSLAIAINNISLFRTKKGRVLLDLAKKVIQQNKDGIQETNTLRNP